MHSEMGVFKESGKVNHHPPELGQYLDSNNLSNSLLNQVDSDHSNILNLLELGWVHEQFLSEQSQVLHEYIVM